MIGGSRRSSQRTSLGELSTRSDEFRTRWASHNVRFHRTGFKDINHRIVGDLHLRFEVMDMPADLACHLWCTAQSPVSSQDGFNLNASWAATLDQHEQAEKAGATDDL